MCDSHRKESAIRERYQTVLTCVEKADCRVREMGFRSWLLRKSGPSAEATSSKCPSARIVCHTSQSGSAVRVSKPSPQQGSTFK